jgi:2-polyprenyl-3-methyl-5-hydroxy-6-metoxy-1,4-benzoquinol methylase
MNLPQSVQLQDVACPVGCPRNDDLVLTGRDRLHDLPGDFNIVKCRTCGLMRTNPRPTPETIGFYYPDHYGPYIATRVGKSGADTALQKAVKTFVKHAFDLNNQRLPSLPPGRMLEVGCASGVFLHRMASQGWHVQGIEFSEKAALAASQLGFAVHAGSLETAPSPDQRFDLVVGWMVLEHLHDPVGCLRKLREWATPGAWLVLSVPNVNSLEFRLFKEKLYALHLPNHLFHFTPKTMAQVLRAGGWTMVKIHHQRLLSNIIASTGHVLRDKGWRRLGGKLVDFPERGFKWSYALYPLAWVLAIFGQTGRMTVWARGHR